MIFKAPVEAGVYTSEFNCTDGRTLFGPRVTCSFEVVKEIEERKGLPAIDFAVDARRGTRTEEKKRPEQKMQMLSKSQVERMEYEREAGAKARRNELMMLYEFGFIDLLVNEQMLEMYEDVNIVAELLM